jgi:hypothetical protein
MPPEKIILIRHAEKPDDETHGVEPSGKHDPESLTPKGWQRAGALAAVFTLGSASLPTPQTVFASAVAEDSKSKRPQQTVMPLVERLQGKVPRVSVCFDHRRRGGEDKLVADALTRQGTVLICWQHEQIPIIAGLLLGKDASFPQTWPAERYDLYWFFLPVEGGWRFGQMPQLLLAGDSSTLL